MIRPREWVHTLVSRNSESSGRPRVSIRTCWPMMLPWMIGGDML
jgi:hypothetical protein